uniref:Putative secreted salivary protein n=1 Tax=Xenopsylla cheopis TaxID=163159 RepID=A2IA84_XENCH|nr:putative secreted salivary protein [Xenopsylla cheopis]
MSGLYGFHNPQLLWMLLPLAGFYLGKMLDDSETNRMTLFRDKSALFGGNVKPGDPPSWP